MDSWWISSSVRYICPLRGPPTFNNALLKYWTFYAFGNPPFSRLEVGSGKIALRSLSAFITANVKSPGRDIAYI